tara:strand:+ start:90 stop:284 length:195 start_codon:yes stop_codon:yes gene_type:complete
MNRFIASVKDLLHFDNFAQENGLQKIIFWARTEAGWYLDDSGWYAPDGTHESEWKGLTPEQQLF